MKLFSWMAEKLIAQERQLFILPPWLPKQLKLTGKNNTSTEN